MHDLEPGFGGTIGRTVAESQPHWSQTPREKPDRPNVVLIVFDDLGWSDLGCYGAEIATPHVDSLAASGLRYAQFFVTPLCSPTRACLLTGRNHHRVGMRTLADIDTGFPNSRGRVNPTAPMLPKILQAHGYGTYLVGKWHLTPQHEITPAGPFGNWPIACGFERFYGFLDGCTDQYTPELYRDNNAVDPPSTPGYHLSTDLADNAIRYLADHAVFRPNDPFYLQLAFGAPHAPLQAPWEYIQHYAETFDAGWDRIREDRLRRQIALGVVPPGTALAPRNPEVHPWAELDADERRLYLALQAAYAGFVEHADVQIGRVVAALRRLKVTDNTLVFVMSDNGASREGGRHGAVDVNGPYSGHREAPDRQLPAIDRIGGPDGPAHYPEGWATVGNTPFRRYKTFVDLGGIRSPLVVAWPRRIADAGAIRPQFAHAVDIVATVLEAAGIGPKDAIDGRSLLATFADGAAPPPRRTQYWETFGHRAIWHDGWRAVTEHVKGTPYENDPWRLYHTAADFSECRDLADAQPDKLRELQALWWQEAGANHVLPLDDRSLVDLLNHTRTPLGVVNRRRIVFYPEQSHVPVATFIAGTNRTMRALARLEGRVAGNSGVLLASGSSQGGYVLYIRDDRLVFEHHMLRERVRCIASADAPVGDCRVGFILHCRPDHSAAVTLLHDAAAVGSVVIPRISIHPSFWGLDIAHDGGSPVSPHYEGQFPFTAGVLRDVTLDFAEPTSTEDLAKAFEAIE